MVAEEKGGVVRKAEAPQTHYLPLNFLPPKKQSRKVQQSSRRNLIFFKTLDSRVFFSYPLSPP